MTNPPWLAPALAYIPQWLAFQMRQGEHAGCSIAVAFKDQVALEAAFGHADLATGETLTPRHRFRVASHSKSFTAAGLLKLRERGRVKLDDKVGLYVKGLHPRIAAATIQQLLSHSAGIFRDGLEAPYWEGVAPFSDEARLREDLQLPPVLDAGMRLKYSNHGFGLAGLVIEAITGEPYDTWIKREIVDAAGLKETLPDVPLPARVKFARGHSGRVLLGKRLVFPGDQSTHALAAATGFVSTASDLVRFFGQLAPNAGHSVLSAASRREMIRPQWRDPHAAVETSYGLGIISGRASGWDWFGHSGGFQGYLTRTAVVPAREIAVSVLTNAGDGPAQVLVDGVLHILARFADEGAPQRRLRDWNGHWWNVWGPTDFVAMGNKVVLAMPALGTPFLTMSEVAVTGPDTGRIALAGAFGSHGEPVVRIRKNGKVSEIRVASGRLVPEAVLAKELVKRYAIAS